jgi:hypothetical protein
MITLLLWNRSQESDGEHYRLYSDIAHPECVKIGGIGKLIAHVETEVIDKDVAGAMSENPTANSVYPIILSVNMEIMQIFIIPAHGNLYDTVQICDRGVSMDSQPTPDHGADSAKGNFDRICVHGNGSSC